MNYFLGFLLIAAFIGTALISVAWALTYKNACFKRGPLTEKEPGAYAFSALLKRASAGNRSRIGSFLDADFVDDWGINFCQASTESIQASQLGYKNLEHRGKLVWRLGLLVNVFFYSALFLTDYLNEVPGFLLFITGMVLLATTLVEHLLFSGPAKEFLRHSASLVESQNCENMLALSDKYAEVREHVKEVTQTRELYLFDYWLAQGLAVMADHERQAAKRSEKNKEACARLHAI